MESNHLLKLAGALKNASLPNDKRNILRKDAYVQRIIDETGLKCPSNKVSEEIAFLSVLAIGQGRTVFRPPFAHLLKTLAEIDRFYERIGGIIGYHLKVMQWIENGGVPCKEKIEFSKAKAIDLIPASSLRQEAVWNGILALPSSAEIYPIGGLGARLDLQTKKGEPLPVACLPFCGKSLLEGLIRDVQAREYLYYKLFSAQITIPLVMMTSKEKQNHMRIIRLCRSRAWFGRPKKSFFLFPQLSVPVVTEEGNWSMLDAGELNLHPGGHGALWRMAEEKGVFTWLKDQGKKNLLIRQINNPIAGIDLGLLALLGIGKMQEKTLGFASCERLEGAAEGALVQIEKAEGTTLSNIEYTDFDAYGITKNIAHYPTNTNLLYVDLEAIIPLIKENPLPGLILNMKSKVPYLTPEGEQKQVRGGRLESMMQNIADSIVDKDAKHTRTFLTYNERKKTISTTKQSYEKGKALMETPQGAFYDLLYNGYTLLKKCGYHLPPFMTHDEYLKEGPSCVFLYHPALGPLFDLIAQKIRRGQLQKGSELQLEIVDVDIENLDLAGSLLITASNPLGHYVGELLHYSDNGGKCTLHSVKVRNAGIDRGATNEYWKNQIHRKAALEITLLGNAEFHADGVTFEGNHQIIVPPGERWIAQSTPSGFEIHKELITSPTWTWKYTYNHNEISLHKEIHAEAFAPSFL